jgi:hypothetical protein
VRLSVVHQGMQLHLWEIAEFSLVECAYSNATPTLAMK